MTAATIQRPNPLDQALRFLALGYSVIPVKSRDKRPSIAWKQYQTRKPTVDEVTAWFTGHDELNIAIITGAVSGVVVVDADSAEATTWMQAHHPSPIRSKTAKGAHFLFAHPGHEVRNGAKLGGMALDVRGDGGYIVAPGSIHPNGSVYMEEGDWTKPMDMPVFQGSWLGEKVQPMATQQDIERRVSAYMERIPGEAEGGRDNQAFKVACKLVREFALPEDTALVHLAQWNTRNTPPLPLTDLKTKIQSALKAGRSPIGSKLDAGKWTAPQQHALGADVDSGGAGSLQDVLIRANGGGIKKTPGNLAKILRMDAQWGPALTLNEMSREVLYNGAFIGDVFIDWVQEQIEDHHGVSFGREDVAAKVLAQASQNTVHPVREWLKTLKWDGTERIHRVAEEVLGSNLPLSTHYLRSMMVGAVRRVFYPGTKVDTLPVLEGPQGLGKSTFWKTLVGAQWFSDSPLDLDSKDGFINLHRKWCTELAELDHMTHGKAAERVKAFLSSSEDVYRPPFGKSAGAHPRSCFMVGTTNRQGFLMDPTGSRRFWPIKCLKVDIELLAEWRLQLWAEAVDLHANGVPHWLDSTQERMREEQAAEFQAEDPWVQEVRNALEALPKTGKFLGDGVSVSDVLASMGIHVHQMNHAATTRVGEIMRGIGMKRRLKGKERRALWFSE